LTENPQIKYVNISLDYESHAFPGVYTQKDFWELANHVRNKIIGVCGVNDNENARFVSFEDSLLSGSKLMV
jgi:hypothetical protein